MHIPQPLLADIAAGRCLPFVGAGFSLNAEMPDDKSMPTWYELGTHLATVAQCPHSLDAPDIAAAYERQFGRVHLIEAIRDALYPDQAKPGAAHIALANLPFDTIYTTNFDLLLEESLNHLRKPSLALVGELQMPFHGGFMTTNIVKMHGDISHGEHIIATREDYDSYLENYPVIATHLSAMLITLTTLFIGYSRTDQDFLHIEDVVKSRLGRFQRMPYLVQFNVDAKEVDSLLDQHQHVISLDVQNGQSKGEVLTEFFTAIQNQLDISQGAELRRSRPDAFEPLSEDTLQRTYYAPDASPLFSSSSTLCFVMMPIRSEFDKVYHLLVKPSVEQAGLEALRADEIFSSGPIVEQVRVAIQQSRVCIVDVTDNNPNVLYELGMAETMGKPLILLARCGHRLPFDITGSRVLFYDADAPQDARSALQAALNDIQGESSLQAAERIVANGMYRAGVANLGILLEHALQRLIEADSKIANSRRRRGTRPASSGSMLRELANAGRIDANDQSALSKFLEIRNKAVHRLEEPTKEEAEFAVGIIRDFAKRYFSFENLA